MFDIVRMGFLDPASKPAMYVIEELLENPAPNSHLQYLRLKFRWLPQHRLG